MKDEEWRPIPGYEGYYEVSSHGRVRSFHITEGKIMKQKYDKDGYCVINMSKNGIVKTCKVHQMVAKTFINNPDEKQCINHCDGNKKNNYVNNLEWCTVGENNKHAVVNKLIPVGEKSPNSILKEEQVIEILNSHDTQKNLMKKYNISEGTITSILRGKTWKYLNVKRKKKFLKTSKQIINQVKKSTLSYVDICNKFGISSSTYYRIKNGKIS